MGSDESTEHDKRAQQARELGSEPTRSEKVASPYEGVDIVQHIESLINGSARDESSSSFLWQEKLQEISPQDSPRNTVQPHPEIPATWIIDSGVPGEGVAENPLLIGAIHGNEPHTVKVFEELLYGAASGSFRLKRGKVTLCVGNPHALKINRRLSTVDGDNLNRVIGRAGGVHDEDIKQRALEIQDLIDNYASAVLCMHSTSKPSYPFAIVDPMNIDTAKDLGVKHILEFRTEEHLEILGGGTTFYGARVRKIPSVTVESGINNERDTYFSGFESIVRFLKYGGLIDSLPDFNDTYGPPVHAILEKSYEKREEPVLFAYDNEFYNFQLIEEDTLIATERTPEGEFKHEFRSPGERLLCLPTEYEDSTPGDYLFMIAKIVS